MSWNNKTLADSMSSLAASAQASLASLKEELATVNAEIRRAQTNVSTGNNLAAAAAVATEDAASSGIYHITLEPEEGSWKSRLTGAANMPPMNSGDYSAVIANIAISESLSSAQSVVDAMKSAAQAVIPDPPKFFDLPDLPALPDSVPLPSLPDPQPLPSNEWKSATMGDVFPSLKQEMDAKLEGGLKKKAQAESALADLQAKADEVSGKLTDAQNFLDSLLNNGVYSIVALPEASPSGDWYTRIATAADAPDDDSSKVSAGTVTVIIAASYADLATKFAGFAKKAL